ncbi:MAG TPA: ABC transporter ATP-binding protein [Geobacterales bacterium]|nr:ABC transporter ATP-binding protein [Geobacterales bacterium]
MVEILKLINVHKIYRTGDFEIHALKGINLSVDKGEFLTITGPSGSGKTTLLNLIAGLDKPTIGEVYFKNFLLNNMSDDELAYLRLNEIGFIFQSFNLVPWLTALENVMLPMLIAGKSREERKSRGIELLNLVGLEERMDHKPIELSGGEQQRVAIARALANNPSIILADEPTGNLDSKSGKMVLDLLNEISRKKEVTVILVTHDLELAKSSRKILRMRDGTLLEDSWKTES